MHKITLYFMFIHRENALKAHQHIILFYTCHFIKKIDTKSDQNIHQDASNCTFKIFFSQGSMPSSMCAADITISVKKIYSKCNQNIH